MAAPKLFRKRTGDYIQYICAVYEGDVVRWTRLSDNQADLEVDGIKNTREEFEGMIYNKNWEEDVNTMVTVSGNRIQIKTNQ
jgi:hypothetical protein